MPSSVEIKAESLAYWYFRLNGFLTTVNFVIHPDMNGSQRTEVDILGVRFPYRAELLINPMRDDNLFLQIQDKPYVVIAEVKKGDCKLNGPWTRSQDKNFLRVLRAIGIVPEKTVPKVAEALYNSGYWEDSSCRVSIFCVGGAMNPSIRNKYPDVPQVMWTDILKFIFQRFRNYRSQKVSHPQWDDSGKLLWRHADSCADEAQFANTVAVTG